MTKFAKALSLVRWFIFRLGSPLTLIRHEKGPFRKRSSNRRNLNPPALRFLVDRKCFENGAFRKGWRHDNHVISLPEFSSNTTLLFSETRWLVCVFKSLEQCGQNIRCVFQSENAVFKFLQGSLRRVCYFNTLHTRKYTVTGARLYNCPLVLIV